MFPNKISFKRFEYPSCLPETVQTRMGVIAQKFMNGIGFNNGLFNIEFMYNFDKDTISIIEVNPRMASQFADLYEKVDGTNTYEIATALAIGVQPQFKRNQGQYKKACSLVLRTLTDYMVQSVPSHDDIQKFYELFPDARLQIFASAGQRLSDLFQDGKSFRYGLVHLGGRDRQDILQKYEQAQELLPFIFATLPQ